MSIRSILAATIASSALGEDVTFSMPSGDVETRGLWTTLESDAEFMASQAVGVDYILRTPADALPSEPVEGMRVTVEGEVFKVAQSRRRGANYLVAVKRVQTRPVKP